MIWLLVELNLMRMTMWFQMSDLMLARMFGILAYRLERASEPKANELELGLFMLGVHCFLSSSNSWCSALCLYRFTSSDSSGQ